MGLDSQVYVSLYGESGIVREGGCKVQHCPLYSALLLDTVLPGKGHIGMCFSSLMQWLTGYQRNKVDKGSTQREDGP